MEEKDCIFPDCQIRTEIGGSACEHSCPFEKARKRALPFVLPQEVLDKLMEHCDRSDDDPDSFVIDAVVLALDMEAMNEGE